MASLPVFDVSICITELHLDPPQGKTKGHLVPPSKLNLKDEGLARIARFSHGVSGRFSSSVTTIT